MVEFDKVEEPKSGNTYLTNDEMSKLDKTNVLLIENIKALDPTKVYCLEADLDRVDQDELVEYVKWIQTQYGIRLICLVKDSLTLITAPEGLEVIQKNGNKEV